MRPITISRQLDAADPNGIALDQTTGGAADLLINGAFAVAGVATLDQQRKVGLESTANLSAVTFTVYGTDQSGRIISEALAGPNNNTVSTILDFLTVTRISVSAAVGTNVEVGTTGVGASVPIPMNLGQTPFNATITVDVTGTIDYTVQYTNDPVFDGVGPFLWFNHVDLVGDTTDAVGTIISPITALRILTNSGDGTAVMRVSQAGI